MFEKVKAIAIDVDGVLTDGAFWWGAHGEEIKRFCFADSTGIAMAMRAGLKIALVSGESSENGMALVQRYADKLKIADVYKGCHDKAEALRELAEKHRISLAEICFIGDDLIDLPAMAIAGISVAPSDANSKVLKTAKYISGRAGGHGVVREIIDLIMDQESLKQRQTETT
jgi:3-deoxy-D-manno-octulosonate 8-phosphate phosphatase (KDO 8-P phosphatase)